MYAKCLYDTKNKNPGFTLIELVIVLAVIAILLAVIIPAFRGMEMEGQMSQASAELNTLKTAVMSYKRHNGSFPTNITTNLTGATPTLIEASLVDPFDASGGGYTYATGTETGWGPYFIISSKGPDFTSGTTWSTGNDRAEKSATTGKDDIVVSNAIIAQL